MRALLLVSAVLFASLSLAQNAGEITTDEAELIVFKSAWTQKVHSQVMQNNPRQPADWMRGPDIMLRWESSPAVRKALVKVYGPEAVSTEHDRYYVVSTAGFVPTGGMRRGSKVERDIEAIGALILEATRTATTLTVKGQKKLRPVKVEPAMRSGERELLFYFPKDIEISAGNKDLEFQTFTTIWGGVIEVKGTFRTREMIFRGKLDVE